MTLVENAAYKSTAVEQMLLEVAIFLQVLEDNLIYNTAVPPANKVNVTINTDARTATISAILPISFTTNASGGTVITADQYLTTPSNTPLTASP